MPNLVETLRAAVADHPDRPAIRMGPTAISYAELLSAADRLGHRLRSGGVVPGDRVAIATAAVPRYAVAYYGALLAGGVVVPLNPLQSEAVLTARLHDARPRTVVVTLGPPPGLRSATDATGVALTDLDEACGAIAEIDNDLAVESDPAAIVYKSGDGDQPTGVVLSHANLAWSAAAAAGVLGLTADDTLACCFPLFHPLGLTYGLGATIAAGCCLTLPPRGDVSLTLSTVQAHGATVLATFPGLVSTILEGAGSARRPDVSTLRTVFCAGGAVLEPRVRNRLESSLGCAVIEGYGTFESSALTCATRPDATRRPGSVGRAVPGVEVAVADGRGREAAPGKAGYLLLRGPNVTPGYWERPQESARAFNNGWLLTGDKVRRDAEGNLYLLDGVLWTDPLRGRHSGRDGLLRRGLRKLRR